MNIVITGASNGIGNELVKVFLANPENSVIGIARSETKLQEINESLLTQENSGRLFSVVFDLKEKEYSKTLIPNILQHISSIDILINNAGLLVNKPIDKLSDDEFDEMFDVNIKAPFRLVRDLLPHFGNPSHVVNISSMGGFQGSAKFSGLSLYSASKGALAILTECMAEELREKKISVNALALGAVQTEMLSKAFPGYEAPVNAAQMAEFIANFALIGHHVYNGKVLPVSLSTP